jgi:phospholipid/cholesterol/gamma-HCH transport system ATP-binding protein
MSEDVIVFRGVTKRFGETTVYENMDLSVRAGETMTIIGGSGQGKSVCLKMMIGLLLPDEGTVHVMGQSVPDLDAEGLTRVRSKVAYVFQGGALFDSMSVLDNIGYGLREHTDLDDAAISARAEACVSMVGLSPDILLQFPANLSGGEKKRVALARSIAIEPEVILYDEPTTGLDPKNITRIGDMIMKLQRELKITSVVVTHDMPMAHKVSDRIALLHDHRFAFVGGADEIWHSEVPEVRDFIHGKIRRHRGVGT